MHQIYQWSYNVKHNSKHQRPLVDQRLDLYPPPFAVTWHTPNGPIQYIYQYGHQNPHPQPVQTPIRNYSSYPLFSESPRIPFGRRKHHKVPQANIENGIRNTSSASAGVHTSQHFFKAGNDGIKQTTVASVENMKQAGQVESASISNNVQFRQC